MIRQSRKTDKELFIKYLNFCGADPSCYKLKTTMSGISFFTMHRVATRQEQIDIIDKINNFDGICYILVDIHGNERVEDYLFLNFLNIYWDNKSINIKRIKRLRKIKARINS